MDIKKVAIVGGIVAGLIYLVTRTGQALTPANVLLSNLVITPTEIQVGQPVTISVDAKNIGQTAGSYEITLEVV